MKVPKNRPEDIFYLHSLSLTYAYISCCNCNSKHCMLNLPQKIKRILIEWLKHKTVVQTNVSNKHKHSH